MGTAAGSLRPEAGLPYRGESTDSALGTFPVRSLRALLAVRTEATAERLRGFFRSDLRFEVVSDCLSQVEFLPVLERTTPDLLILDLDLLKLSGSLLLSQGDHLRRVVLLLDHDPRLERLLESRGLLYLHPDCAPEQFDSVITLSLASLEERPAAGCRKLLRLLSAPRRRRFKRLAARVAGRLVVFEQGEIFALEAEGRATVIHLGLESHRTSEPFSQLSARLDAISFFKINRNACVNVAHVKEVNFAPLHGCSVQLHNGRTFEVPFRQARRVRKMVEALCKPRTP